MSGPESTARQRKPQEKQPVTDEADDDSKVSSQPKARSARKRRSPVDEEDDYSPYLDIFRVLTFVLLASCGLSYLISNGESFFWGMKNKPDYLKLSWWKMQYVGGDHGPYSVCISKDPFSGSAQLRFSTGEPRGNC